ncbi:CDGSH iron-sulfur domain-containing protein 3, mitochondrial [Galendromus occidentalis]|uniref:CDGSH iron-sulfur domain-containing protein 3, mitochondrial n=1 Tax=Galendromus occidentalis TaxID=34638 RepID=A0AAJ6QR39_9ACAR|nr:CDGSH iron-sulfur domain-containing protein 3, mitochondrial [Galendromus occidentalis]
MLKSLRSDIYRLGLRFCSKHTEEFPAELKPRKEAEYHASYHQKAKGRIYDRKPMLVKLRTGRQYFWCTCGWSHSQPFCDGTHKNPHYRISLRPMRIVPEETREYWLCNCKQSSKRPFCDGTHKTEEVATAPRVYKNGF